MQIEVNGRAITVEPAWQNESLLHWLREANGLVGAKFGCGAAVCGACTVLVDGQAARSCVIAVRELGRRSLTTIEGLAASGGRLHPVQQAWLDEQVPQCGFCQSGQIMSTIALLRRNPRPDDRAIDEALAGNLCRCGTHQRIRAAVKRAAAAAS
jgi:isoquinoline 1-oxidoreductase subunit alpha